MVPYWLLETCFKKIHIFLKHVLSLLYLSIIVRDCYWNQFQHSPDPHAISERDTIIKLGIEEAALLVKEHWTICIFEPLLRNESRHDLSSRPIPRRM